MRWDRNSLALRLVQVLALVPWNLAKWKASRAMILHHQSSPILLPLLLLHLPHLNLLFKRNVRQRNQIKKEKKRKRKTARRRKQKLIKKRKQKQIKKRMLKTQRKRNQAVEVPNIPPLWKLMIFHPLLVLPLLFQQNQTSRSLLLPSLHLLQRVCYFPFSPFSLPSSLFFLLNLCLNTSRRCATHSRTKITTSSCVYSKIGRASC